MGLYNSRANPLVLLVYGHRTNQPWAIGAFVGTITVNDVKDALTFTPVENITKWCKDSLEQKLQSKKIEAYSDAKNGTEVTLILL